MNRIQTIHFMLQLEVAQRLIARPGEKSYSRLSVLSQCFSQTQLLLEVPPEAFQPPPKVYSALVRIQPQNIPQITTKQEKPRNVF